ncbi:MULTISPECIES: GntR family transcriptional regulator [Ferrimicrobium]|uniref:GntR family transcriptional regulator n=2 Tax=Acidimicrobiaceae TaxID=84994 RepID=UPI0023F403B2|nr:MULTISPECIES: GntR family transcriptional regulator [Ferrimicrobium]
MMLKNTSSEDGNLKDLRKIEWVPLQELVYRELRRAIMSARYAPGQVLTVRATAAALGVSSMPVRAAFSRLVAERVVQSLENGTVVIPTMSRDRFDDLVNMRVLLEGTAAELAASRVTQSQLANLKELALALGRASKANDLAYLDLNQSFKFTVCDAAGSPTLKDLIERLWLQFGPFMSTYATDIRNLSSTDEYLNVVDALSRGDVTEARLATVRDILGGAEFIIRVGEFVET